MINRDFYWDEFEDKPKDSRIAHIVKRTKDSETPGGTECERSIAYCGSEALGYTIWGDKLKERYGNYDDVTNNKINICNECLNLYSEEQKYLKGNLNIIL